jgi:hypothetical protein
METHKDKIRLKDITDYMCDVVPLLFRKYLKTIRLSIKSKLNTYPMPNLFVPAKIERYLWRQPR